MKLRGINKGRDTANLNVHLLPCGDWFATLSVGGGTFNAPGGSAAQAALNAYTAYASRRADIVAVMRAAEVRLSN